MLCVPFHHFTTCTASAESSLRLGLLASRLPASEGINLHRSGVRATLVTATEDKVLNSTALRENLRLLPEDLTRAVFVGGNHAGFGHYNATARRGAVQLKVIHP